MLVFTLCPPPFADKSSRQLPPSRISSLHRGVHRQLQLMSPNQQLNSEVLKESSPQSGPTTPTPAPPSIFTLMSRMPYIPPTSTALEPSNSSRSSADHTNLLTEDVLQNLDQELKKEKLVGPGTLKTKASSDISETTLSSLTIISANNLFFSPTSGWDDIKM